MRELKTAADPFGIRSPGRPDLNLYAYCTGEPINRNDPNGEDPPQPQQGGVGITIDASGVSFGAIGVPSYAERARLLRLIAALGGDGRVYAASPPSDDEFGTDEDPLGWDAVGWEDVG